MAEDSKKHSTHSPHMSLGYRSYQSSTLDNTLSLFRLITAFLCFLFLSFLLSDLLRNKVPYELRTTTSVVEVYELDNPQKKISTLTANTQVEVIAREGKQAYITSEKAFSRQLYGVIDISQSNLEERYHTFTRLYLFFGKDPLFAYLFTFMLFGGWLILVELRKTDVFKTVYSDLMDKISESRTLQKELKNREVQMEVLKQRHHRELINTSEALKKDIVKANLGLKKVQDELHLNEQQLKRYEAKAEETQFKIEQLQQQIKDEISKKELQHRKVEELEAEKEGYRSEVVRVSHMLNHKKLEVQHLRKEIERLKSNSGQISRKESFQLDEKHYGRTLHLHGKVAMKDIKTNFRILSRMLHPDRFETEDERTKEISTQMFSEIKTAFEYFKDKYGQKKI